MERNRPRRFLTPSMVVAFSALVVALGGTSYAVTKIDPRSVGSKELKKNAVARAHLKRNAVNASKVAPNTLKGADIDEASLAQVPAAADRRRAPRRPTSPIAPPRPTEPEPPPRSTASSIAPRRAPSRPRPTHHRELVATGTARCDAGLLVVGGGVRVGEGAAVVDSFPDGAAAWTATVANDDPPRQHVHGLRHLRRRGRARLGARGQLLHGPAVAVRVLEEHEAPPGDVLHLASRRRRARRARRARPRRPQRPSQALRSPAACR